MTNKSLHVAVIALTVAVAAQGVELYRITHPKPVQHHWMFDEVAKWRMPADRVVPFSMAIHCTACSPEKYLNVDLDVDINTGEWRVLPSQPIKPILPTEEHADPVLPANVTITDERPFGPLKFFDANQHLLSLAYDKPSERQSDALRLAGWPISLSKYVITGPQIAHPIHVQSPSRLEAIASAGFTVWTQAEWDEAIAINRKMEKEHPDWFKSSETKSLTQ